MDFMKDGEWHQCNIGAKDYASFYDSLNTAIEWLWHSPEHWEESKTKPDDAWTNIHPYNFKLPENPDQHEWQYWDGMKWEATSMMPLRTRNKYTFRYRPLPKKSRLEELAEKLGVDEELLREALKEVSK